jgi:hypothetical protein
MQLDFGVEGQGSVKLELVVWFGKVVKIDFRVENHFLFLFFIFAGREELDERRRVNGQGQLRGQHQVPASGGLCRT